MTEREQPQGNGPQLTRRALLTAGAALMTAGGWPLIRDEFGLVASAADSAPAWPTGPALRRARVTIDGDPYAQTKDPCPVLAHGAWHLYGTGWTRRGGPPEILHARATDVNGPYAMSTISMPSDLVGTGIAAPGVVFEDGRFHMFIQTEFARVGGTIEHLSSRDGEQFEHVDTALTADANVGQWCIYDAQPAIVGDRRLLVYAAARTVGHPQIHLAESVSGSWAGPWRRHGPILTERQVPFHNQPGTLFYEWGLEGPQLMAMPNGGVLLSAVCFLAGRRRHGTRQRVFLAAAPAATGPYRVLGLPLQPSGGQWDSGENGHAGVVLIDDALTLLYQGRSPHGSWSYGTATFALPHLDSF